ncbi:MAG: hypothetical protein ACKVVP_04720 [Chloroflexota bacterium]
MATVTVQPEQPMPRVAGHLRTVSIPTRYAALAAVCLCAALTVFFSAYTADTAWSFPRFLIAAFVLIYVPGQCVLRRFGSELPQLENLLLSVILGMVTSSVIYAMCTATHVQPLFLAWPSVTSAALLWETRRRWDPWLHGQLQVSGAHLALALVLVATLAPLVINPRFLTNFDLDPEGVLQIRSQILDALLHLSVVHELSHSFPPSAQFLSGVPLAYHVGSDIVPALLIKMGGAHHLDVMFRYIPAVYLGLLILATFTAARRWLGSAYGGVLVAMLVALGEDFSFIPGILRMSTGYWSVQYFEAPSTFSFYTFNPMLLAVTVFFSALLTLQYWWTTRHASWFLITALLLALLIQLKIFLLPHIIVSLAAVGIVAFARWRDGRLLALVACTLAIAIPLYLVTLGQSESAERQLVRLFPFQYLDIMLREFGLGGSTIGTSVKSLYFDAEVTISTVLWTVGVALPVYLIGAFGWRMIGASLLLRSLWPTRETQLRAVAAVFVLTGAAVTLLFSVSAAGIPARETYNNAIWFIVASKHMAWLFAVEWIVTRARASTMSGRYLLVLITLCLSLPSTIQTF